MNKKIFYVVLVVMFAVSVSGLTISPQSEPEISYGYTDTIQERANITEYEIYNTTLDNGTVVQKKNVSGWHYEKDGNTYLFDVGIIHESVSSRFSDGSPKDVDLIVELEPNNLTKLLNGNEQPFKDIRDGKHEDYENGTDYFNQHYYYEGGNISSTEFNDLENELSGIPVYENGSLVKNVALKDKAKNVTAKVKFRDHERSVNVKIGSGSAVIAVSGGSDDSYDKFKPVNVTSVSGTPTVSKVQPVNLTCGDDSTTGTGVIEIDCANVNGVEDVDFTNSTDHRLNYEFESFNLDTGGYAMAWVYGDWVRDGKEQLRVHYGSGSTDEQDVVGTWDNTGQNAVMVQHLQDDPLTATDSTSNNNDGSVTGAVSTTGEFDGAGSFDGTDDQITFSDIAFNSDEFTLVGWHNSNDVTALSQTGFSPDPDFEGGETTVRSAITTENTLEISVQSSADDNQILTLTSNANSNEWYYIAAEHDSSDNYIGYLDGSQADSVGKSSAIDQAFGDELGAVNDGNQVWDGKLDAIRYYSEDKGQTWHQAEYDASPKAGQVFFSQSAAETGDSISPNISYNPSTISSGTYSRDWVLVNVTATDETSLSTVTEEFDGTNSSFNTNQGDYYWTNHTGLADGSYSFQAFAEDDAGNTNSTEEWTVTLDTTAPSFTTGSPENITYNTDSIDLNVTSDEAVDTWQYSLDGAANTTFTPNTTISGLSDGGHTVDVYANDSSGNTGSQSVSFTVDTPSGYVLINDSVQINQSGNNAVINVTQQLNVSNMSVYSDAVNFGGINWSISGDSAGAIDIKLSHFNDENPDDTYLANYSISEGVGNVITSNFVPRPVDSVYQITRNGSFLKQVQSDAQSVMDYSYEVMDTAYASFTVKRTDQFRPEINSTNYELDQVNGNERFGFVLWSRGANDIASSTGVGSRFEFTNTSMVYDVGLPVDGTYSVTDFPGLTRNRQVDLSKTDTGVTEDSGFSHTLDSQKRVQTVNFTLGDVPKLNYTWNSSLGQDFTGEVDRSSTVSNTASETSDFLNNQTFNFNVDTSEVVLGFNYTGHFPLEVNNTASNSWSGVDTTGAINSPNRCSTSNNTAIDISANTKKNFSVEQNCNPGVKGNPVQDIVNASGSADERIWYNSTDMTVYTNKTSNTDFAIRADKSNLKNPNDRDSDSLEAVVEGVSSDGNNDLNISDTGSYFRITVGDIQSSTLYTDDSDWSVTYTLSGDNTTVIDGGGGGGSPGPSTDDQTVYFGQAQTTEGIETFNIEFGTETVRNLTITNTAEEDLTAQISTGSTGVCQYIEVRPTLSSDQWSSSGSYSVDAASLNNLGTVQDETVDTQIRFDLPNRTELENVGITDYSCEFTTGSSYGVAEPLTMELEEGFSLNMWLEKLNLFDGEYCFTTGSLTGNFTGDQVESGQQICLPQPTILTGVVTGLLVLIGWIGVKREWF